MEADANHLERMGRELKCPICLSLLNSSASLNCNHVFCNSCILKSMKSGSNCPVCKVPYRRREIRPVPHMDNLVSIYKSMEVSSGVNLFITQNVGKLSDGKHHVGDSKIRNNQDSGNVSANEEKVLRENRKPDQDSFGSVQVRPSFPGKKRVQVQHVQSEDAVNQNVGKLPEKGSKLIRPAPSEIEYRDPGFTPFFWLKDDEDVADLSQDSGKSLPTDLPLPDVPTFSDIKDSDDENSLELTSNGGLGKSSNNRLMFDSEMFEWTQRPCSPELCSSPSKTKVTDSGVQKNDPSGSNNEKKRCKRAPSRNFRSMSTKQGDESDKGLTISSTGGSNLDNQVLLENPKKRGRKAREMFGATCPVKSDIQPEKIHGYSDKRSQDCLKPKTCKRGKTVQLSTNASKPVPDMGSGEAVNRQDQGNKDTIAQLSALFVPLANKESASVSRKKEDKVSEKATSSDSLRSKLKSTLSCNSKSKDGTATKNIPNSFITGSLANPLTAKNIPSLTNDVILQRCENNVGKIQCAFCLSSEDSEASGEMVHYYNGKPVAADYNGGSKVIHSHRNCTEWAPNVYFEDDVAINLEAELARSRRIKCSCCEIKGAALGCYDKSCRKSFHVPCAKLMPQCRWDMVNFVMLCPLHPFSKFPTECSETQARKKKRDTKKASSVQHNKVSVKHNLGVSPTWSSRGSSKKPALCCSALTSLERELVSEFGRISGVTVANKWASNVTHVIASTDENGACKRTLKVLMGILNGKWILSIKWIKACTEAMKYVGEESFELTVDTHGITDGPRTGRLRIQNKLPKLFEGFKLYLMGEFAVSYKTYLQDLITAAGGTVLHRKPVPEYQKESPSPCQTYIIYSVEQPDQCEPAKWRQILDHRRADAEAVASSSGAKVGSNSWVLNSIAACKLQCLA